MDVLSLTQFAGGLSLRELLTRLGRVQPDLALLQVAGEVKAGNVSVSSPGPGGAALGDGAELRRLNVQEIAERLGRIDPETLVVDATERSYRFR